VRISYAASMEELARGWIAWDDFVASIWADRLTGEWSVRNRGGVLRPRLLPLALCLLVLGAVRPGRSGSAKSGKPTWDRRR